MSIDLILKMMVLQRWYLILIKEMVLLVLGGGEDSYIEIKLCESYKYV